MSLVWKLFGTISDYRKIKEVLKLLIASSSFTFDLSITVDHLQHYHRYVAVKGRHLLSIHPLSSVS